jgi:hypothetical protein
MARIWLGLIAAFAFVAAAQAQKVERIIITDPGLYDYEVEKVDKTPDSVSTGFKTIKNVRLLQRTERIPATLGTSFGFRFEIVGEPRNEPITLRFVTRFPAGGLRNPQGKVLTVSENDRTHRIGESNFRTYTFDEAWEAVPGTWTLEFWYQGRMVGSQKFEVVKADAPVKPEFPRTVVDPRANDRGIAPPAE